jgi:hypothetical protein
MQIFARLTKVDEAARTVTGIIANEALDHSGEVFDYDSSKPNFEKWSGDIAKATAGKSVGNVRAMHGSVCAGITKSITFDDVAKAIEVEAKIVDDNEWNKTLAGCYTGFSIGGSYARKWKGEDGVQRYTACPLEYSLVDLPCNPDAQFSVIKADGSEELRKYDTHRTDARQALAGQLAKRAVAVEPIALALAALLGKPLAKGMCDVAALADILNALGWVADDAEWEASWEGDGSTVPADLRAAVKTLAAILVRMATEESQELAESLGGTEKLTPNGDLHKGAPMSQEDAMDAELKKSLDTAQADLAKAVTERDNLQKALDTAATEIATRDELLVKAAAALDERNALIEKFQNAPAPVRAALTAIAKGQDIGIDVPEVDKVKKADGSVDEAATAIKKALMNPVFTR